MGGSINLVLENTLFPECVFWEERTLHHRSFLLEIKTQHLSLSIPRVERIQGSRRVPQPPAALGAPGSPRGRVRRWRRRRPGRRSRRGEEGAGCSARCGAGQSGGAVFRTRGGEGWAGASRFPQGRRSAACSSELARGAAGGLRSLPRARCSSAAPPPSQARLFCDSNAAPTASGLPLFGLLGSASRASHSGALRLVSAGRAGAAPAGAPHPGPAAVMLLRLPPLRPGGQLAEAGAGTGAPSPLAGTPPSPALGSRGRRGTPGPGAAWGGGCALASAQLLCP